jgi:hypothetical protein
VRPRSLWALAVAACACSLTGATFARAAAEPPTPTARPSVAGIAAVGKQLTAQTGTWASSGALTYAYQWYRCDASGAACLSIHGAVSATYSVVARDAGQTLGLAVTATDPSGGTDSAYASLVGPIAPPRALLESTVQPAVTGTATVDETLEVSTGAWSPTPAKLGYVWQRCNANGRLCTAIAAATGNAYTVSATDVGHTLVALVQGTFGTTTQAALSTASAPVAVTYAYQWYRCDEQGSHCNSVHGATAADYRLTARDVGETIGVTERATDVTGTAIAYTSLVGPVAASGAALAAVVQASVSGQPKAGATLTAGAPTWTAKPRATTYVWLRCNANGRVCTAIPDATAATYTPTAADFDHRLVASITATGAGGPATAFSLATAPVA